MIRSSIFALLVLAFAASSCNDHPGVIRKETETTTAVVTPPPAPTSVLDQKGTADLMTLLGAYYGLKDAMVASDTSKSNAAAARIMSLEESLNKMLADNPTQTALRPHVEAIIKQSEAIVSNKDNNIELKRASFEKVSDAMYALLKDAKMKDAGAYHAYCPMAFNDKGAYWLSSNPEIQNPYFGKKMMECGEVKDSL